MILFHMLQKSVQINVRSIDKNKENMKDVFDLTKIVKVPFNMSNSGL